MIENEQREFYEIVGAVLQAHNRTANLAVMKIWWCALKIWPLDQVTTALETFVREGGNPVPASIVALLPDLLGHPVAEEAWNAAQKDERTEGAYMSGEMLNAACAASDSLERGDMIGARRCFIDVYNEKVKVSRREGSRPCFRYFAPLAIRHGQKKEIEAAATQDALTRGWLPADFGRDRLEQLGMESGRMQWMPNADVKKITKQG